MLHKTGVHPYVSTSHAMNQTYCWLTNLIKQTKVKHKMFRTKVKLQQLVGDQKKRNIDMIVIVE